MMMRTQGLFWALLLLLAWTSSCEDDWLTRLHEPGYCALTGICGHRPDGDVLSCPSNKPAAPLDTAGAALLREACPQLAADVEAGGGAVCCTAEQLERLRAQIQIASIFLIGCPACNANFKQLFCLLTCSPDQATFANVTAVQAAADTNTTAVAEVSYYVSAAFGGALYNSCADVVYPAANLPAMKFVGGGAANYLEWLGFLGLVKDRRFPPAGSPFQMDFPPEGDTPEGMAAMGGSLAPCGEGPLACSCGDCPAAPDCKPVGARAPDLCKVQLQPHVPAPGACSDVVAARTVPLQLPPRPPAPAPGCPALRLGSLRCGDLALLTLWAGFLAFLPAFARGVARQQALSSCGSEAAAGGTAAGPGSGLPAKGAAATAAAAGHAAGAAAADAAEQEALLPATNTATATAAAAAALEQQGSGEIQPAAEPPVFLAMDPSPTKASLSSPPPVAASPTRQPVAAGPGGPGADGQGQGGQPAGDGGLQGKEEGGRGEEEVEEEDLVAYPATEQLLRRGFYRLGRACAGRPRAALALAAALAGLCCAGLGRLRVVSDPQALWVGAGSRALREKQQYEASLGPFYRVAQLVLSTTPAANSTYVAPSGLPAIVTRGNIKLLFQLQRWVDELEAELDPPGGVGTQGGGLWEQRGSARLEDVCVRPLGGACATQSVLQYWQLNEDAFDLGAPSPDFCFGHWSTACLADYGGPVDPHLVLGGFPLEAESFRNYSADATALVTTYLISPRPEHRGAALAWEAAFLRLASARLAPAARAAGLELSFSAERSVADELARESSADAPTVALSYLAMLAYIALGMATLRRGTLRWRALAQRSRGLLGLSGVAVVAASSAGALGLAGWAGLPATLIMLEVIPFLVLAIGVDNMFLLAAAAGDQPRCSAPAHRAALALAAVGPSITLAASAEAAAFALGTLTSMPALRAFSAAAAAAVALNFLLQITAFVAMLALDEARLDARRYDCVPWLRPASQPLYDSEGEDRRWLDYEALADQPAASHAAASGCGQATPDGEVLPAAVLERAVQCMEHDKVAFGHAFAGPHADGDALGVLPALRWYMRSVHAPLLRRPAAKASVLALFSGLFLLGCAAAPRLQRGLEQQVALPGDSYLQRYFADVAAILRVGPPVLFVVRGLNLSAAAPDVRAVCSVAGCDRDSLVSRISAAARAPWESYLGSPAASWLDDFASWASPEVPQCCRQHANASACPPPDQPPCAGGAAACADCAPCLPPGGLPAGRLPSAELFQQLLPQFLRAVPSQACAKGGAGAYTGALQADPDDPTGVAGLSDGLVAASAFRASHTVLSQQADFIGALQASRELADRASAELGLDVYAYSPFYIFFEGYLSIGGEAVAVLGSAGAAVFLICLAFTGSPWAACLILGVLSMLVVELMGAMHFMGMQFNAVSVVNLVMSLGIGVEFVAHLVHAFMEEPGPPDDRMAAALGDVGAAVLSGIALTKLVGVSILAFARTRIFEVYYFRMYLALVLLGAANGLVLLPVLLSVVGPEAFAHWGPRQRAAWLRALELPGSRRRAAA